MLKKLLKISQLMFALIIYSSCATLPGVEEPSDSEINAEAVKAYADVKAKSRVSTRRDWNDMVHRVAQRVAAASGENFQWEYVLLENPEPNAWCMPGGKIAVNTGILPILKTEGALAAVLGHEVAHATLRHGKKGYARAISEKYMGIIVGGAAAIGGQLFCKTEQCRILAAAGGMGAGFAITFLGRRFSREDETEADKAGQIYMAKAGYDPAEASVVWQRMSQGTGATPPEFMSTHPANDRRESNLRAWLPDANTYYHSAPQKYGRGEVIRN